MASPYGLVYQQWDLMMLAIEKQAFAPEISLIPHLQSVAWQLPAGIFTSTVVPFPDTPLILNKPPR